MRTAFRSVATVAVGVGITALAACGGGGATAVHGSGGPGGTGTLYFSQDGNVTGLFTLDTATGLATAVGAGNTGVSGSTSGLTETADPATLIASLPFGMATVAADGSGFTTLANGTVAEGLAMHIGTGTLFGAINNEFFLVDPSTGAQLANLSFPPADVEGIGVDLLTNRIYAVARFDTRLLVYDIAGDNWSVAGNTGISFLDPGLAFDHVGGIAYAIDADSGNLYALDPTTGAATNRGSLGVSAAGGLGWVAD